MATIPMMIRMSPRTPIFSSTPRFPSSSSTKTTTQFSLQTHTHSDRHILLLSNSLLCMSSRGNGTECPVPLEQQPINEYQSLSTSFPFSWAAGDVVEYSSRLIVTGFSFALFVGLPVAWFGSVGAQSEPLKRIACAASSGALAVTFAVLRMYLGWAYVGNRLLSATVELLRNLGEGMYDHPSLDIADEETGWYDGQIWVKTAEVLARDRLLGSFSVKPVLSRLKVTLVSLATCLLVCALILINIDEGQTSKEAGVRVIPGVYNDDSARSFEPDAFCGEPDLQQ